MSAIVQRAGLPRACVDREADHWQPDAASLRAAQSRALLQCCLREARTSPGMSVCSSVQGSAGAALTSQPNQTSTEAYDEKRDLADVAAFGGRNIRSAAFRQWLFRSVGLCLFLFKQVKSARGRSDARADGPTDRASRLESIHLRCRAMVSGTATSGARQRRPQDATPTVTQQHPSSP
jgi:hypothetical protein